MVTQNRWRSPVVWTSGAALLALVLKAWLNWEIPALDEIVTAFLAFGIALGIINNPTSKNTP
jgi:uncharacterized membrane protein